MDLEQATSGEPEEEFDLPKGNKQKLTKMNDIEEDLWVIQDEDESGFLEDQERFARDSYVSGEQLLEPETKEEERQMRDDIQIEDIEMDTPKEDEQQFFDIFVSATGPEDHPEL